MISTAASTAPCASTAPAVHVVPRYREPRPRRARAVNVAARCGLALALLALVGCSSRTTLGGVEDTVQNYDSRLFRCAAPVGNAALVEPPEETRATLEGVGLGSPVLILRLLMGQSGCFAIVDRGAAYEVMMRERELAEAKELEEGSQMDRGQMVAADFLITPGVLFQDANAGGRSFGAIIGALVSETLGVGGGGVDVNNLEAQVLLTLTNVRTGVQDAVVVGSARKQDSSFSLGALLLGGSAGGGVGGGAYESTDIGKIVMAALLDSHNRLVMQLGGIRAPRSPR